MNEFKAVELLNALEAAHRIADGEVDLDTAFAIGEQMQRIISSRSAPLCPGALVRASAGLQDYYGWSVPAAGSA